MEKVDPRVLRITFCQWQESHRPAGGCSVIVG